MLIAGRGRAFGSSAPRSLRGLLRLWVLLALVLATPTAHILAEPEPDSDYALKAVWLYKFAYFVSWPESAFVATDSPLVIGVLGEDPFGELLDSAVGGERVGNRDIVLIRYSRLEELLQRPDEGTDRTSCHILFVARDQEARYREVLAAVSGQAVLTVGETPSFSEAGGVISLKPVKRRLRIEINNDRARSEQLSISSRLLRVARIVKAPDASRGAPE